MQRTSNLEDEGGFTSFIRHVVPVHRSKMAVCGLCNVYEVGSGVVQDKLVSSTDLIKWNGHRKEILKLTFRAVVLLQLWQMANILNVSFRITLQGPIQIIKSVDHLSSQTAVCKRSRASVCKFSFRACVIDERNIFCSQPRYLRISLHSNCSCVNHHRDGGKNYWLPTKPFMSAQTICHFTFHFHFPGISYFISETEYERAFFSVSCSREIW